jgi:hypothetical protein
MQIVLTTDCLSCADSYAIVTCNSNAIRDDSWHLDFDGTFIGNVDIDTDAALADIMLPARFSAYSIDSSMYSGCSAIKSRFDSTYLDSVDFLGDHTLKFTCYQLNGANNFFTIKVVKFRISGGALVIVGTPQNLTDIGGAYIVGDIVTRDVNIALC